MKSIKILIGLFTFVLLIRLFNPSHDKPHESINEFSSHFYQEYHDQLNSFLNTHVGNDPAYQKLAEIVKKPLGDATEKSQIHEDFVNELRKALKQNPHSPLLQDLIQWIYLKADLKNATQNYFYQHAEKPGPNIYSYLMGTLSVLRKDQKFDGSDHETIHEDQYLHGNFPSYLFTLPNSAGTKIIRMGHPLSSLSRIPWVTPSVYPEFLAFVQMQPSHLYVNLMKRSGEEYSASKALERLEKENANFALVTLDKNSAFYTQKERSASMKSLEFKDLYFAHLTAKDGDFHWPMRLNQGNWQAQLKEILDKTHQRYFDEKTELNRQERLDFIELSYLAILDQLVEILQPNSMNITCRQCMDRGPAQYVLWMLQKNQVNEQELAALLLAPPLLLHNRPSHPSRIERFISAAERM